MPSNKGDGRILRALKSIIQSRIIDDVEVLVNLDGPAIRLVDRIHGLGIRRLAISNYKGSLAEVLNFLIDDARADIVARADDDDHYLPGRLDRQFHFMSQNNWIGVSGGGMYLSRHGVVVGYKAYPRTQEEIIYSMLFNCHAVAHPVACFRRSLGLEYRYSNVAAEDMDLWVRLLNRGVEFANLDEPLFIYSLPEYSSERKLLMMRSVFESVVSLLVGYWEESSQSANVLAQIFHDQITPDTLTSEQINAIRSFHSRNLSHRRNEAAFMRIVGLYHPKLNRLYDNYRLRLYV